MCKQNGRDMLLILLFSRKLRAKSQPHPYTYGRCLEVCDKNTDNLTGKEKFPVNHQKLTGKFWYVIKPLYLIPLEGHICINCQNF